MSALRMSAICLLSATGWLSAGAPAVAAAEKTSRVQSTDSSSVELFVRHQAPAKQQGPSKAVLFVHGASYPSTTFATPVAGGPSWMARMAQRGYHAYAMDMRGYGRSSRPPAMGAPAADNPPFARAEDAVGDIDDVIEFIRRDAKVDTVDLVGWSWGTVTSGLYATRHGDKLNRLVLYAPVYSTTNPAWTDELAAPDDPTQLGDIGAYRTITREAADARWAEQITADSPTAWRDPTVFKAWFNAMLAAEPGDHPTAVTAPNGVLVDIWHIFHEDPIYDAAKITTPTLVIRGDADPTSTNADALGLFHRLASATKRYVVIGDATHFAALETNAPQLFAETALFLAGEQ